MDNVDFNEEFNRNFETEHSLGKKPNILLAGYTGCGKSSLIRTIIGDIIPADVVLLKIMDIIDDKVNEIQQQLIEAQDDKDKKEELRQANQEKMDWYNNFCKKLQDILAV